MERDSNYSFFILSTNIFFIVATILTFKRPWTLNFIIWGMYLAIIFTPIFTVAGAYIYRNKTQDGFAGLCFLFLFVPLEIIAILMFIVGCIGSYKRRKRNIQNEISPN